MSTAMTETVLPQAPALEILWIREQFGFLPSKFLIHGYGEKSEDVKPAG